MSNVLANFNTKVSSVAYHPSPIDSQEENSKLQHKVTVSLTELSKI